ncbi:MAG TPA: TIGR01777 family oxidoreductase [candidate division Zixibacteria bacterium]|nr:TIGR01777 family oxidoreductase [candidate division Zixibacteria bacterium]
MNLMVTGATGFIGSVLTDRLASRGHALTLLMRSSRQQPVQPGRRWITWTPGAGGEWESLVDGADGIINLAGEPIAARRWTRAQKQKILASRVETTEAIVRAIDKAKNKPAFLLNASAIGYYGDRGDETITEQSSPGVGFLAETARKWEEAARKAEPMGVRVVYLRIGIVLGRGGVLAKMLPPFRFFLGGPLGTGKQWVSWIHMDDQIDLMMYVLEHPEVSGPVNATAPNPVTMKDFCRTLAKVLHRPCWLPVPALVLRLALGEMADVILTGQKVLPAVAQKLGYRFRYPHLEGALRACLPF